MRKEDILSFLNKNFTNYKSMLDYNNGYELLIAVVLSAQTTDIAVNKVTPALFTKYKNFKELALASTGDVENIIKKIGLYKNKAKNIINLSKKVVEEFNSCLPNNKKDLVSLPGVGNKTSNVVLNVFFNKNVMPVDTHIERISKRLNIASTSDTPDNVEQKLYKFFKNEDFKKLHHQLIYFGRNICKARQPLCSECSLQRHCNYYKNKIL